MGPSNPISEVVNAQQVPLFDVNHKQASHLLSQVLNDARFL
jgi:hypothetical protein